MSLSPFFFFCLFYYYFLTEIFSILYFKIPHRCERRMVWWGKHCLCRISCYNSHKYGIWSYHCFPTWICPLIASWMEGYEFCGTYCYMSSKMVPDIVYFVFFHPLTSKNSNSDWSLIIVSLLEFVHWLPRGWKVMNFVELTVIWVLKWFLILYTLFSFILWHPKTQTQIDL